MSIEAMAIALHHSRAEGVARLVLIGIANHDSDGGAWPSVATLAKYAAVQPRAAQYAIKKLQDLGEISVDVQSGGLSTMPNDRRPNLYHFLLSCPPECDRSKNHRCAQPVDNSVDNQSDGVHGGAPRSSNGVHVVVARGARGGNDGVHGGAPEPYLEPSKEPLRASALKATQDSAQIVDRRIAVAGAPPYPSDLTAAQERHWRDLWLAGIKAGKSTGRSAVDADVDMLIKRAPLIHRSGVIPGAAL